MKQTNKPSLHIARGTDAIDKYGQLQNRLHGTGKMMQQLEFTTQERLYIARALRGALSHFPQIDRALVFSRFFEYGELSEEDWSLNIKREEP